MKKKMIGFFSVMLIFLLVIFLARFTIMKSLASFLIVENEWRFVEYGFVLSGGAYDRGSKAAELYQEGKVAQFVCTGANQSSDLKALGSDTLESDLTKLQMMNRGIPDASIYLLKEGTSTLEESEVIMSFALQKGLNEIVVVSSKFHTRRVKQVFVKKFAKEGIDVLIAGAPSSLYNEMHWWESEYGLIALNNEYIKQLYYFIKY